MGGCSGELRSPASEERNLSVDQKTQLLHAALVGLAALPIERIGRQKPVPAKSVDPERKRRRKAQRAARRKNRRK
jgi:hypothetical protein